MGLLLAAMNPLIPTALLQMLSSAGCAWHASHTDCFLV